MLYTELHLHLLNAEPPTKRNCTKASFNLWKTLQELDFVRANIVCIDGSTAAGFSTEMPCDLFV